MSRAPFFSIITPTYNRASFLEEMIASVSAQYYQDYEHIIIDDGSTDETEELIKQLKETNPKIVYIKQDNKGRSVARNVGIEAAKGEFICFLDSDDKWSKNYLEALHASSSKSDFLATKMVWVNGVTQITTPRPIQGFSHLNPQIIMELQIGMNVCIRRSLFDYCLFNTVLSINEDFELWTRIICQKNIDVVAIPESIYLVITPEFVGQSTNSLLDGMLRAQKIMKLNPIMKQRVPSSFWKQRSKGILLNRIRLSEKDAERWKLISLILKYLVSYPSEPVNKSLLVTLLYNLPGGNLLKSLVTKTKSHSVK